MIDLNQCKINRNILLIKSQTTVTKLAQKIKYTRRSVYDSLFGENTSYNCHRLIAASLQMPMVEIWPELYGVVPNLPDHLQKAVSYNANITAQTDGVN